MNLLPLFCVLFPMAAAPAVYAAGRRADQARDRLLWAAILLEWLGCAALLPLGEGTLTLNGAGVFGMSFAFGGVRTVFAFLCATVFVFSALSSPFYFGGEERVHRYYAFFLLTLGGIEGVFLSADLFTTFFFFEIMSMASWVWVAQNETAPCERAANTYLAVAVIGGLLLLGGVLAVYAGTDGLLQYEALRARQTAGQTSPALFLGAVLLTLGFGAKAGMFPLHIWLPKAYPVAPAPASALLSGILTKSGVFGILMCGVCLIRGDARYAMLLLGAGVVTMLLGALLALTAVDLKRVLACSSLSQIGFILVAAAMLALGKETSLAAGGALLHAVNHALIKSVLFLSAGVIYKNYHTLDLNELRGAGRGSRLLAVCFLTGALSIAGVPLFGGYVSKTLIHEAIVEHARLLGGTMGTLFKAVEGLFLFAGGLTLAYMTKLFVILFVQKRPAQAKPRALSLDRATGAALAVPALGLFAMGAFPNAAYERIAAYAAPSLGSEPFSLSYFSLENLRGAMISLLLGAAVYGLVVRLLLTKKGMLTEPRHFLSLEENVYKPLLRALAFVGALGARSLYCLTEGIVMALARLNGHGARPRVVPPEDDHFARYSPQHIRSGAISQTLAFELMLFGLGAVLTLLYLLFS